MNPETPAAMLLTKYTALTLLVISFISIFAFWAIRRIIGAASFAGKILDDDGTETEKRKSMLEYLEKIASGSEQEKTK